MEGSNHTFVFIPVDNSLEISPRYSASNQAVWNLTTHLEDILYTEKGGKKKGKICNLYPPVYLTGLLVTRHPQFANDTQTFFEASLQEIESYKVFSIALELLPN